MMWDGGVSRDMYPVPETGHYPKDIPINGTGHYPKDIPINGTGHYPKVSPSMELDVTQRYPRHRTLSIILRRNKNKWQYIQEQNSDSN